MSARPGDAHHTRALSAQHKDDFLKALGSGMTVADACKVAGVKSDTVKYWTKTDKKFRELLDDARISRDEVRSGKKSADYFSRIYIERSAKDIIHCF